MEVIRAEAMDMKEAGVNTGSIANSAEAMMITGVVIPAGITQAITKNCSADRVCFFRRVFQKAESYEALWHCAGLYIIKVRI